MNEARIERPTLSRRTTGRLASRPRDFGGAAEVFRLDIPGGEDHAALRETPLMLHLCPGLADLSELDPSGALHIGIFGDDPLSATADFGRQLADQFVAEARKRIAA